MSAPIFLVCLTVASLAACASIGRAASARIETDDTAVDVEALGGSLALASLRCRRSGHEWIPAASGRTVVPFIAEADVEGRTMPLTWQLAGSHREPGPVERYIFTFRCAEPHLELRSEWRASAGPGPVEQTLSLTNLSAKPIRIPLQPSLRFDSRTPPGHSLEAWWVEKGAGNPSDAGTHHEPIDDSYDRSLLSTPYSEDDARRDAIPWVSVQDSKGKRGWYAGIEFSGRVRIHLQSLPAAQRGGAGVRAELGLAPEPAGSLPYHASVAAGETFTAPTVFVGCYTGDVDDGANRLRRWVATNLRPPVSAPSYPLLTLNSWGSGMAVNAALAARMIDDAAALGLEMFHIDAGWFRDVGDWRPDPAKLPEGLAAVADRAHAKGLKFGLWVGWTQGGIHPDAEDRQAILSVFAPDRTDWFTRDYPADWKPGDFTGADLCLAKPEAEKWCVSLLDRLVRDYRLDMLEHDQRMIVQECARTDHSHTGSPTDIAFRAANGYYKVYDALRVRHPHLLFEDCVNGGRTVDYGIVRRVDYISITDTYNPLANRRAFYDASYALPPAMCECYVENTPARSDDEFRTMLRSGMMGWCTIMCDTTHWSAERHAIASRQFNLYKTRLRPLILSGDLYHLTDRPDGRRWDAIQYASHDRERGAIFAFRGTNGDPQGVFHLRGLDARKRYRVTFEDGDLPASMRTGGELMQNGVAIALAEPGSSQIVLISSENP